MPASLDIFLTIQSPQDALPSYLPYMKLWQSKVRYVLNACEPSLLADLNAEQRRIIQPYALSPLLLGSQGQLQTQVRLLSERADHIAEFMRRWWNETPSAPQQNDRRLILMDDLICTLKTSKIKTVSPVNLLHHRKGIKHILFHFHSPTVLGPGFSLLTGKKRLIKGFPFPEPGRLFYGLLQSWNYFYPELAFDDEVAIVADTQVEIVQMQAGQVHPLLSFGTPEYINGFTGSVLYRLPRDLKHRNALLTLGRFAEWSGVGLQPTLGLGFVTIEAL